MTRFLIVAFLLTGVSSAAEKENGRVKALMHNFLLEVSKVSDLLNTDAAFSSQSSRDQISKALANMAKRAENPPTQLTETPGFRITFDLLADHISKTKIAFDAGEYEYARMRLLGMPGLCASCHTQVPQPSRFSPLAFLRQRKEQTNLNNANFLFTFRRYDEALSQFDQLARTYPSSGVASDALDGLYRKKLAIFARVKRQPQVAIDNLKTDLKNKNLPLDIQRNIGLWIEGFEKWKSEKVDPSLLETADLLAFVDKNLPAHATRNIAPSHPQVMMFLRLSGLLYERLYKEKDSPRTQEMLYYLAECERSLAPSYWYSISEIYLKECIVGYPKKAFSKKCYMAYEKGMQERYVSKPIPESVRTSLEALKKYL